MRYELHIERKYSNLILGIAMRYARLKAGLSLRDLGELANISHTLIGNIENGKTVANPETLRQMFAILGLQYRDDQELIDEYRVIYERVFHHLYYFQYEKTNDDIAYLRAHPERYENSIVSLDNALLQNLHAALTQTFTKERRQSLDLMARVVELLSTHQRQLYHLVRGVDLYHQGRYKESLEMLAPATTIGDHRIDPLIRYYQVANQVHMYHFMDAQKNAVRTIREFEEQLNYERAMLVRMELVYSSIANKRFDEAHETLDLIAQYRDQHDNDELDAPLEDYRIYLALMERDTAGLNQLLEDTRRDSPLVSIARLTSASKRGDHTAMRQEYDRFCSLFCDLPIPRGRDFVTALMMIHRAMPYDETTFIATFERIIETGKQTHDQGLLRFGYHFLIDFYKSKRKYKKALDLSEEARTIRSYGPSLPPLTIG